MRVIFALFLSIAVLGALGQDGTLEKATTTTTAPAADDTAADDTAADVATTTVAVPVDDSKPKDDAEAPAANEPADATEPTVENPTSEDAGTDQPGVASADTQNAFSEFLKKSTVDGNFCLSFLLYFVSRFLFRRYFPCTLR
eukprot:TRINITY_DN20146_c0_g1_i3.p1 TRINITY_DN20146_c0_g1~~TRINITY_DN20146_c0_g1_i3.p1  ORF type:complete len:142 (-),score=21.63 TRINITY_DN20146_c0_g1_i3:6-431(-)